MTDFNFFCFLKVNFLFSCSWATVSHLGLKGSAGSWAFSNYRGSSLGQAVCSWPSEGACL